MTAIRGVQVGHQKTAAAQLAAARAALSSDRVELARLLGLAPSVVARWERGETFPHIFGRVLLTLLDGALQFSEPAEVRLRLKRAQTPTARVRVLCALERGD